MSPSTTARPEVMYSNAKPFALARSTTHPRESSIGSAGSPPRTTSAPESRMQKRESAEPWTNRRPRCAPYANDLPTEPFTRLPSRLVPFMIETVPPSIVLPTPSWAPPSTLTTMPQALKAPNPWPATEPPLNSSSASTSSEPSGALS